MEKIELTSAAKIVEACRELSLPWVKAGMSLPRSSVIELARITKLPPRIILEQILTGDIVLNGRIPSQQATAVDIESMDQVRKTKKSRLYQRTAAKIWAEGQRYQRRFQFQPINPFSLFSSLAKHSAVPVGKKQHPC